MELSRKMFNYFNVITSIFVVTLVFGCEPTSGRAHGHLQQGLIGHQELDPYIEMALELLDRHPIVDGHNDLAYTLRGVFRNQLTKYDFSKSLEDYPALEGQSHTDLVKLRKGKVGGQFWSIYASCDTKDKDAIQVFLEQVDVIKRLATMYPEDLSLVTDSKGLKRAFNEGKIASMMGVESGHAIANSLAVLRMFYDLGVRYMTLTHSCNTAWADSSVADDDVTTARSGGLSEFGKDVVKEMNRLGMLVDLSHVSERAMHDALDASRAPVIFSHSSARAIANSNRNVPDDLLGRLKINRGLIMVNFYSCYITEDCRSRNANLEDVAAHLNHIKDVIGADWIGIGGDYNGVEQLPNGLENVSMYPNLFALLLKQGWTEEELGKLASGNVLRVLEEVEDVRDALVNEGPSESSMPSSDYFAGEKECRTDVI